MVVNSNDRAELCQPLPFFSGLSIMRYIETAKDWVIARIWGDGPYQPPERSLGAVAGVPFAKATRVGRTFAKRFDGWDAEERARMKKAEDESRRTGKKVHVSIDENKCRGLYQFQDGTLFWESKMALCTDGARRKEAGGDAAHRSDTSHRFSPSKEAVDAELVPYVVVPTYDDPEKAKTRRDFAGSKQSFVKDFRLEHGNLGVVMFEGRRAGVIFADEGPARKIGETSIRVHELIRKSPHPWQDNERKKLEDSGVDNGVLYFIFPGTKIDINQFGPALEAQRQLAKEIEKRALSEFDKRFPRPG